MTTAYIISLAYTDVSTVQGLANQAQAKTTVVDVESSADRFGWNTQPFSAIDGHSLSEQVSPLTAGQLGCARSHLALWKLCLSQSTPIIVLEDDVEIIAECHIPCTDYELLKLHRPRPIMGKPLLRQHKTFGVWSPGAYAYYLTPSAADKLVNWVDCYGLSAVDKLIGSNIVNYGHVEDALIRLIPHRHSSTSPLKQGVLWSI